MENKEQAKAWWTTNQAAITEEEQAASDNSPGSRLVGEVGARTILSVPPGKILALASTGLSSVPFRFHQV
jgi:hypothetical protein